MSLTNIAAVRGSWQSGVVYSVGDIVVVSGYTITCLTAHTAGTFATDVNSNYWNMSGMWKNHAHNGNFDVWQRGGGSQLSTNNRAFGPDRWGVIPSATGSNSVQISRNNTTVYPAAGGTAFSMNFGGNAQNIRCAATHVVESLDVNALRGKTVTFHAQVGSQGNTIPMRMEILAWTGTADSLTAFSSTVPYATWSPYTLASNFTSLGSASYTFQTANIFQKMSVTGTVPTNANNLVLLVVYDQNAGNQMYVNQAMLNEGVAPAPFQTNAASIEAEFAVCQRFYQVFNGVRDYPIDLAASSSNGDMTVNHWVPMRTTPPTGTFSTNFATNARYYGPAGLRQPNAVSYVTVSSEVSKFNIGLSAAATQFTGGIIRVIGSSEFLTLSAEI